MINNIQQRNITDAVTKLFDHQETGKNNKNLAPRTAHKCQRVIQPVAFAHQQMLALRCLGLEAGKAQPGK